jgi:transcriptional regulator EpsA
MRVDDGQQVADQRQPRPREPQDSVSPQSPAGGNPARFDPFELESLMLNLDASLRIRARHQFFGWTQGTLQSLIEHQLLICALHNGGPAKFHVDSFSIVPVEPTHFSELFRQDVCLVPHLIKSWEENHSQVVSCEAGNGGQFAGSALARELTRLGASQVVAHGTHDATGQLTSFFAFACRPGAIGPRQTYYVELLVPFLHSAWVRTQVNWQAKSAGVKPAVTGFLTPREREILEWIYRGKSNIEVGMILKISPLTAKNHVQKILRKLGVLNRTQAVGKALALRILNT